MNINEIAKLAGVSSCLLYTSNPLEDDEVDRAEVEVWQHMELTVTNRVRA